MLKPRPDLKMYEFTEPYIFPYKKTYKHNDVLAHYQIPKGFIFDGFSNPRLFWRVMPSSFGPRVILPGAEHDYFFRTHEITYNEANLFLKYRVMENGISENAAKTIYYFVDRFGHNAWRNGPDKPLVGEW